MALSPSGRIRINVTGARGGLGIDLQGVPTPGQFLTKVSGGNRRFAAVTPVSGPVNAVALTDLASNIGASLVGTSDGDSVQDFIDESRPNIYLSRVNPPASSVVASDGGSGNLNGTYTWRTTFVNQDGETESSVASNTISLTSRSANLSNIPTSADPSVTARRIYRTVGTETASEMGKLVGTINNNTSTTFNDNVPDAGLGARAPWINTTGGNININGNPLLVSGFATSFGVRSNPNGTSYATTSMGSNTFSVAERVLRSEAFGVDAGEHLVSGEGLTFVGTHAGGSLINASDCVAIGYGALQTATGGTGCVAIGRAAASEASGDAVNITAIGAYAHQLGTTAGNSTCIGSFSGYGITTGIGNTTIGAQAGQVIAGGNFNSYVGFQSGFANIGSGNVAIGFSSLSSATNASDNTAIGPNAGKSVTIGTGNTFIGSNAGNNSSQKADAFLSTVIGSGAFSTRDNEIVIGSSSSSNIVIAGVSFTKAQIEALLALVD